MSTEMNFIISYFTQLFRSFIKLNALQKKGKNCRFVKLLKSTLINSYQNSASRTPISNNADPPKNSLKYTQAIPFKPLNINIILIPSLELNTFQQGTNCVNTYLPTCLSINILTFISSCKKFANFLNLYYGTHQIYRTCTIQTIFSKSKKCFLKNLHSSQKNYFQVSEGMNLQRYTVNINNQDGGIIAPISYFFILYFL
eukprot:TRINITY_DN25498_c0_g1_i3.p1 TRINITY_DN25498_c0_g1~~TRINITY_DN25498_c0_g1_i3.p1  ORF type:complete len:199 (+),score=-12.60 TRINITY_DN25498_c0_g1_i3:431-1027(+)